MNESAEHASGLIELHVHLKSSHFLGSFGTVVGERVVGGGGGNGEAEHVPLQFHGKEGLLDRCGACDQIFMLACVMYGLLGSAGADSVVWMSTKLA